MCRIDSAVTVSSSFASDDRVRGLRADPDLGWSDYPRGEQLQSFDRNDTAMIKLLLIDLMNAAGMHRPQQLS
jgi:hypothetical protein